MKRTLLISAICLSATALFAGSPASDFDFMAATDTLKQSSDTSHFFMGRREILVTNGGKDIHFIRNRFSDDSEENQEQSKNPLHRFNSHWESFNFGIGGFGSGIAGTSVDSKYDYIDVDPIRSFAFHWNITDLSLSLTPQNRIGLVSGIGVTWDFYALSKKNVWLEKGDSLMHFDTVTYKRNKLRTCNMVVPLMLEFHPVNNSNLYVMAGVEANLRLGARTKHVTEDGVKNKHKSDFYMNPITCNMVVRAGYEDFGVYFSTALTPMFKDNKGPEVYPFSAGVSLNF
ncbi:MAG: outer membrane beta-barrel protein [Salinivirgaceae bacterium]|nr:outer membrane beta-barrel protein [Salinivirgaceae bacterium]